MKSRNYLSLSQYRIFGKLAVAKKRVEFWFESKVFKGRYGLVDAKSNYRSFQGILQLIQAPFFFAILFALGLQYLDPYLDYLYDKLEVGVPTDGDYVTFLATVAGIGGVFIGLYYAAISTVGGAIYATVPNNIRDLLAQERFGNVYMRFLSFLTFLSIVLILLRLSGQPRSYLAVVFVAASSGIGIFAFVSLGKRAFYLFDPTKLSSHIFEELHRWLAQAKVGGYRWSDPTFQNHARKQASRNIGTLETLADITAKEIHLNDEPFIELSCQLTKFLAHYEVAKRKIPTDSQWYEKLYQHKDWYRTDDSQVSIAHQTGTALQPDVARNSLWVEARITPILLRCVSVNLIEKRYAQLLILLEYVDAYIQCLAKANEIERAFEFLKRIAETIFEQLEDTSGSSDRKDESLDMLALMERLSTIPISIALGHRKALARMRERLAAEVLNGVNWGLASDIYSHDFPSYCLGQLEWLRPRLEYELRSEDKYLTPMWYRQELLRLTEARRFDSNTSCLILTGSDFYEKNIAELKAKGRPWLSAALMSREKEYWSKIDSQTEVWLESWNSVTDDNRIVGLTWPQVDLDSLRVKAKTREAELVKSMAEQGLLLILQSRSEEFPDYAGQFLHTAGEIAFEAMLNNDQALLEGVFTAYLFGCFFKFDSLRVEVTTTDWRAQQEMKIAAASLMDLLDISGYAKLCADFHNNQELWNIVVGTWDRFLSAGHDPSPLIILAGVVRLTESGFEVGHRSVLRTRWKGLISNALSDVPTRDVAYGRGVLGHYSVVDHDSLLVRIFGGDRLASLNDGIDIFIALFVRDQEGGEDLDFGPRRRDFRDDLEREARRSRSGTDGDGQ